jgi:branched-chain amino acid transport system substrate-binding protein
LREAKDLVLRKRVDFLSGTVVSSVALAISPFAKERKKIFIVDTASDKAIMEEHGHRYIFRVTSGTRAMAYATANYVKDLPYSKYWIMGPDYAYGHSMGEMFMEKIKELRPDVEKIGESWPKFGTTDFTPYISAIMAAKPDVLFSSCWGSDWVSWLKQAKPMGFHEKILEIGGEKGQIENLVPGGKNVPGGLVAGGFFMWWDPALATDESEAFVSKAYERSGKAYPSTAVQTGYITVHTLARAIEKAGTTDTEKIIDALEGMEVNWMIGTNRVPFKTKIRSLDHHFGGPITVGVVKFVPEHPFPVTLESKLYSGEQILPTEKQIRKARGQ